MYINMHVSSVNSIYVIRYKYKRINIIHVYKYKCELLKIHYPELDGLVRTN